MPTPDWSPKLAEAAVESGLQLFSLRYETESTNNNTYKPQLELFEKNLW